jgi:RNA recognition motif-containing protein
MAKKLYIGNISPDADKARLKSLFAMFGKVKESYIVKDERTEQLDKLP